MRNDVTFDNLELDAIELSKKCEGPEIFVEKRLQKKFFDELASYWFCKEVLDPKFLFRYLLVNVTKGYPSLPICMNQT